MSEDVACGFTKREGVYTERGFCCLRCFEDANIYHASRLYIPPKISITLPLEAYKSPLETMGS